MMNAKELAQEFSLEELRTTFDAIPTEVFVFEPFATKVFVIGGREVKTTPTDIGDAKLLHRGWIK